MAQQIGPRHRAHALADGRHRRQIDEDRSEQRQRDADAAQDEILPGRLQRLMRPVDADHHDGRERGQFDGDPHQADIVGRQRQVHAEHHQLEHHVVEAQIAGREASRLQFVPDVAGAEDARREARRRHSGR